MNRRESIAVLGVLSAFPSHAMAQRLDRVWRVGFMAQIARPEPFEAHFFAALPRGLHELGYVEGRNLAMEWRFGDSKLDRLPGLAADLVKARPDVIATAGSLSAIEMHKATSTIPIVFGNVSDPVASGLVKILGRPGGNMTGLSSVSGDTGLKVLEMLVSLSPKPSRVAVLVNPVQPVHLAIVKNLQAAATAGVRILPVEARNPQEIEPAFAEMARVGAQGLIVPLEGLFIQQRRQIVALASKARLATISTESEFAKEGGLLSYGADQSAMFRQMAVYVDKILKGARPADLPVELPTTFELVINNRTAKALGVTIPQTLAVLAGRVIE